MANIGHFGDVQFYVSRRRGKLDALSFSDATWNSSANYEEHKRNEKKPVLEYTGNNLDEFSMNIYISAYLLQSPMMIVKELRKYCLSSKAYPLVLGGNRIGANKFVITNISNDLKVFSRNGKPLMVSTSVTFKEYPVLKNSKKKKVTQKKKTDKVAKIETKKKSVKRDAFGKAKKSYSVYTAKKDTTLWAIAQKKYQDGAKYKKIFDANQKKDGEFHVLKSINETIRKGWKLKIPK